MCYDLDSRRSRPDDEGEEPLEPLPEDARQATWEKVGKGFDYSTAAAIRWAAARARRFEASRFRTLSVARTKERHEIVEALMTALRTRLPPEALDEISSLAAKYLSE